MATRLRRAVALGVVIAFGSAATAASAADLPVPAKYRAIARAMRAANPGDRVVVSGGTWKHVRVTKANVALVGQDGAVIVGTATVSGRGAELSSFTIDGSIVATKHARAAIVRGNALSANGDIVVAVVDGNDVAEGTIHADGDDAVISGNTVACAAGAESSAIDVRGTYVSVKGNDVSHSTSATGIVVRADGVQVVSGEYSAVTSNVVTGARCGINVCAEATDTLIANCTATGACMGLMNAGTETSVTGCTFTGNRDHDVAVSVPCHVFTENQFSTSVGTLAENAPPPVPEPDFTKPIIFIGDFGD